MSPKTSFGNIMFGNSMQTARGSALMIAVFILLLSSAVVYALLQLNQSQSSSVIYEVQGLRTYNLARAQLELAAMQLYPINQPAQSCAAVSSASSNLYSGDWQGCQSSVQCSEATVDSVRWFYLQSSAQCGDGDYITSRVLEAELTQ